MRRVLVMALVALLSACSAEAQNLDAGVKAYELGDYAEALNQLRPLAEAGDAKAQSYLGVMYGTGRGVLDDYAQAHRWFRLAANQNLAEAQNALGVMYFLGQGVPADYVTAHMWFNISCSLGKQDGCKFRTAMDDILIPAEISEAQRRASICMESEYKDCD